MLRIFAFTILMTITLYPSCEASVNEMATAYVNPYAAVNNPCADIRNGQFVCLDCATLAWCLQEGGDWVTIEYETCRTDKFMYCDEYAKGCTLQQDCQLASRGPKFECQNPGHYPDPYDCKYYHVCSSINEDTRHTCPPGIGYSVETMSCSIIISGSNNICKQPQYNCDRVGARGSWPGDSNIYYICHAKRTDDGGLVLYPILYRCQPDKYFNGESCVLREGDGGGVTPPGSNKNTGSPQSGCNNNQLIAHQFDCRSFYRCTGGKMVAEKCPPGMYFNKAASRCDYGNC